jgi:hypothetical protein
MKATTLFSFASRSFSITGTKVLLAACSILLVISTGCKTAGAGGDSRTKARSEAQSDERSPNEFERIMQRLNGPLQSPASRSEVAANTSPQATEPAKLATQPTPAQTPTRVASIPATLSPAPLLAAAAVIEETNSVAIEPSSELTTKPLQASVVPVRSIQAALSRIHWPRLNRMTWVFVTALLCAAILKLCRPLQRLAATVMLLGAQKFSNAIGNLAGLATEKFKLADRATNAKATAGQLFAKAKAAAGRIFDRVAEKVLSASTLQRLRLFQAEQKHASKPGKSTFKPTAVARAQ